MVLLSVGEQGWLNEWIQGRDEQVKYVHLEELQQRAQSVHGGE